MSKAQMNPWRPITHIPDLKPLNKMNEELGELTAATSRCLMQGMGGCEPVTGKLNRHWLEEEIADVLNTIGLTCEHFNLDQNKIMARAARKNKQLREWFAMKVD